MLTRIDPAGDGELNPEDHYRLTDAVVHTITLSAAQERLNAAERVALVAVCGMVASAPALVLGDFELALPLSCTAIDDALAPAEAPV